MLCARWPDFLPRRNLLHMGKDRTRRPARSARVRRDSKTLGPATVRCHVRQESGVHAVSLEQAIAEFGALRAETEGAPRLWIDIICPGAAEE